MNESPPARHTRYQGFIVENDQVLLIKHLEHATRRSYWVFPGGGREPGETEEECVAREMNEETNLDVSVVGLLLEEDELGGVYKRRKTYLCKIVGGTPSPGYEPEPDAAANYSISEVRWFELCDEGEWDKKWGTELCSDPITYPQLVQAARNYLKGSLG